MRIFAGDFTPGEIGNAKMTQTMLILMASIMLIPIVMILLSLILTYPMIRWVTIIGAISLFVFNIVGLPGYPGMYDKFLISVGLAINVITIGYAWTWT